MKKKAKLLLNYFSNAEKILFLSSVSLIISSFLIFDRENYMTIAAYLIGVTSLIFNAKGNPLGQILIIIFSVFYGIISYSFEYYGEMITYLGMSAPMAVISLISWIRNPFNGNNRSEVKINRLKLKEIILMFILTAAVTFIFYYILKYFHTENPIPSTISITTSFLAVYLTFRRSIYFLLSYAANDIVLIILCTLATISDILYLSVAICFLVFFANDVYGFINRTKIQKRQESA